MDSHAISILKVQVLHVEIAISIVSDRLFHDWYMRRPWAWNDPQSTRCKRIAKLFSFPVWLFYNMPIGFIVILFVPILGVIAISGGLNKEACYLFLGWCLICFMTFLGHYDQFHGVSKETHTIERLLADATGLAGNDGKWIISILVMSLLIGGVQYNRIPQSLGGGKIERVIVVLKHNNNYILPSLTHLDGRIVDLVFRRGTKYGFKAHDWRNDHIIIIDQESISAIYAGSRIDQLDPSKLNNQ